MRDLASLVKSNAFAIEMAEVDLYGWDTHQNQDPAHPDLTYVLSRGIADFVADLGDTFMRNVVIFVISEFGRTCRQNGTAGTDHGSASLCYVVGHPSKVLGRGVYTNWAGLSNLRDGRDLRHSHDFRAVLSEILERHMGGLPPEVFPGYTPTPIGFMA
jgi:uncharacterized protein (DUF1501 family)